MTESLTAFRASLTGDVLAPSDREYERARLCFNLLIDRRPAAIARCVGRRRRRDGPEFRPQHDLEIAVRGGGHNPAGHCAVDDGLVIDLSQMRNVEVDPEAGIARSEGGATWMDFDAATQAHGLVTPGGVVGSTGVTGLTLGGGIGHLTAQYGLTCDNLIAASWSLPRGRWFAPTVTRPPSSSGACAAAAATSASRRGSSSASIRSSGSSAGSSSTRGTVSAVRSGRFRDVDAGAGKDLSCQAQLTVDEALTPALTVAPCYTGSTRIPMSYRRCARRRGSSTTGSAPRASSTSSGSSTPATALIGTTGRAISSASCQTS